jgi:hypothetical protein
MNNFNWLQTSPRSRRFHEIGIAKIKEILRYEGYRIFAQFGEEIEYF